MCIRDRIKLALENKEKIVIYGDYDVDGITSTAILYQFLSEQGTDVDFYIPNRSDEGYGINMLALQKIKTEGASLLVTCLLYTSPDRLYMMDIRIYYSSSYTVCNLR